MKVDLNSMVIFAKVVEFKSFSEASLRIGIPVSTISRKVAQLEKSLDTRLIERTTRQLRLTDLGQIYYEHCCRAIQEFDAANLAIHNRQSDVSGLLRISIPPSLERCLILPLVTKFQEKYPNARIRIWITNQKMNLLEEEIDLALRVGELKDSSLIARQLIEYRHVLVASPDYLQTAGTPTHPTELKKYRLISFNDWYGASTWTFAKAKEKEKLVIEESLSLNDFNGAQYAAEQNQGITEIPSIICNEALQKGRLVEVLPEWRFTPLSDFKVKLSFIYPSNRNLSRLVKLFKDFCIEHVDEVVT